MRRLTRLWRRLTESAGPPSGASPATEPRLEDLLDQIVRRLGFDPEHPGWTDALGELHRHSRRRRLQVIPDFFYTPVWAPADLPESVWDGTFLDCGRWDLEAQRAFLRETPSFAAELSALSYEHRKGEEVAFHWGNDQFSHSDASLYYSMIRRFRPARIVEVGAGHSTRLAHKAVRDNGSGRILCIDPHAPRWLSALEGVEIVAAPVQQTPDSVFLNLRENDVLFIDGSHISKTGSDVNHLFLRILPRMPKGVLVHIHDICLPYEYPKRWAEEVLCYWNEQYVLAALLANGTKYEILLGVYFLQKQAVDLLKPYVPSVPGVFPGGGSLWLRSRE